jgi:hypothetical protein
MKKIFFAIVFILAFAGCERDSNTVSVGQISFTFDNLKVEAGGRTNGDNVPAFILLSIETSVGAVIEKDKKIELIPFGNSYLSQKIELPIGNFKLTKFIILNSDNKAIFATPVAGSSLAKLANKPLPIEFTISGNGVTQVIPEVLPINPENTPGMFGYMAFGFTVKKRILSKTFFEFDSAKNELIESWKYVYTFEGILLKETNEFDMYKGQNLLYSRKFFEYNQNNQLTMIKFQPFVSENYFHVKIFDHSPTETKITMFEMTDQRKSPEYYTVRKITSSNVQLADNYRTIDYTVMNGNLASLKLSDKPFVTNMEYDSHTNPEYFIDELSELSYSNTEIGSRNNLIKSTIVENGVGRTVLTVSITYDADGYPATRIYEYATGEKFKYSYTYQ